MKLAAVGHPRCRRCPVSSLNWKVFAVQLTLAYICTSVSLFFVHINLRMIKGILVEEQQGYYWTHSCCWGGVIRGFNTFPKVNIIVQLEFELAYYDVVVHHIIYNEIFRNPSRNANYEFVLTSPAVSSISCSFILTLREMQGEWPSDTVLQGVAPRI